MSRCIQVPRYLAINTSGQLIEFFAFLDSPGTSTTCKACYTAQTVWFLNQMRQGARNPCEWREFIVNLRGKCIFVYSCIGFVVCTFTKLKGILFPVCKTNNEQKSIFSSDTFQVPIFQCKIIVYLWLILPRIASNLWIHTAINLSDIFPLVTPVLIVQFHFIHSNDTCLTCYYLLVVLECKFYESRLFTVWTSGKVPST